jgi:hypothetical protein
MSIPDVFMAQPVVVVATDMTLSALSDDERAIARMAQCCASGTSGTRGFYQAFRMLRRYPVTEFVVIGPAHSRALQRLIDVAEHAGITVRRHASRTCVEVH